MKHAARSGSFAEDIATVMRPVYPDARDVYREIKPWRDRARWIWLQSKDGAGSNGKGVRMTKGVDAVFLEVVHEVHR
jgi:hypothetical protein